MTTFQKDFRRFQFPGFGQIGACFLRVQVNPDGTSIFLCSQLKNYTSTSITSAVEEIFVKAISELQKAGLFKLKRPHWYSLKRELSFSDIVARSLWVEHYPKGTGISNKDSYALVSFDRNLSPAWDFISLERAIKICGVEKEFFLVSPEDLEFER
jgi:hypothetical protein